MSATGDCGLGDQEPSPPSVIGAFLAMMSSYCATQDTCQLYPRIMCYVVRCIFLTHS